MEYKLKLIKSKEVKINANSLKEAKELVKQKYGSDIEIETELQFRTKKQNNALHKFFQLVADELNDRGLTWDDLELQGWELVFTSDIVKNHLWKPIQKELTGRKLTRQLFKSGEIDNIYDTFNKKLSEFGIYIPFPNKEELE